MKILIVDDEPTIRAGLRMLLMNCFDGIIISGEAKHGKEALELIKSQKPDILITDILMPVMDGLQLIESIREKQLDIDIIVLSGHSDFEYARHALRLGVNEYLLKPVTQEKMNEAILSIVRGNPNRWIGQLSPDILREMKRKVDSLIKYIVAEEREAIHQSIDDWKKKCNEWGLNLGLKKHLIGHLKLVYETELLATWPSMPVLVIPTEKTSMDEHELYSRWTDELLVKVDWIAAHRSPRNRRVVEQVMEHIKLNYSNPELSIHHLAEVCGISSAYLSKIFRETENRSLTQTLGEFRIKRVKESLDCKDDYKLSEIAENCGFNDYPYFSKLFKKIYGLSPQEYRDK